MCAFPITSHRLGANPTKVRQSLCLRRLRDRGTGCIRQRLVRQKERERKELLCDQEKAPQSEERKTKGLHKRTACRRAKLARLRERELVTEEHRLARLREKEQKQAALSAPSL